jgi:DNA repair protein RadD
VTARQRHRSRYALHASATSPSTAQVCRDCGHVFAPPERRELRQVEGELQELAIAARARKQEQGQAQSLQDLIALGQQRGYKNPVAWAKHLLAARQTKSQWSKGK